MRRFFANLGYNISTLSARSSVDRVLASEAKGPAFEPRRARQKNSR